MDLAPCAPVHTALDAHVLVDGRRVLGCGEVWRDAEEDEAELARIIVAPGARGTRLGWPRARPGPARPRRPGRVHGCPHAGAPGNDRALRCYLGAGFRPVAPGPAANRNTAQPVDYVCLRHHRDAPHH
ncbi:hypothetical protein ACWC2M_34035 [Streptomyces sp. NPDC001761]